MSQSQLLIEAIKALERAGVGYFLSGSFASSMQGEPRATHDIDLVIEVDARVIEALSDAFGGDSYFFDEAAARTALLGGSMFNLIDTRSGDKVDFWALSQDPFDESRFARRTRVRVFGIELSVSAPEDTILQKLKWARACGGSERQLRDAAGVYELQAGSLDERYLDEWAFRMEVHELLDEVRRQASA